MAFISGGAQPTPAANPEALFRDLARLDHGPKHLWAHQADILRDYLNHQNDADLAIELPTGAGKTLVGMLIGEWRRSAFGERVVSIDPMRRTLTCASGSSHTWQRLVSTMPETMASVSRWISWE